MKRPTTLFAALTLTLGAFIPQLEAAPFSPGILNTTSEAGQTVETIPLEATAQVSPPLITIKTYAPGTFTIYRKDPSVATWGTAVASNVTLAANATWVDSTVALGTMYEYRFVNTGSTKANTVYPSGYILCGIQVDQTQPKGMIGVIVASDLPVNLPAEYAQYKADLVNDGWQVREIQVPRAANYNGIGNAALASVTIGNGGTTSVATGGLVHYTNASGKTAVGTLTTSNNVITRCSIATGGGGTGFTAGEALTLSGGTVGGNNAYLYGVTSGGNSALISAYPKTGGSGYTEGQAIILTGQTTGATTPATLHVSAGAVSYFTFPASAPGFQNGEILTMSNNTTGSGVGPLVAYVPATGTSAGNLTYAYVKPSGTGYTQGEPVTLRGNTTGKTAQGTISLSQGYLSGISVTSSETGFNSSETLSITSAPTGSGAPLFTGSFGGPLTGVNVSSGGTGYTNGSPVQLTYGAAKAQATLIVSGGIITGATITSSDSGFSNGVNLGISAVSSGYTLTVGSIDNSGVGHAVNITSGGSGYSDNETVTIKGGSSNATAVGSLIVQGGVVTGVSAVLPNTFTAGEALVITSNLGGSGLVATAGPSADNHLLIRSAVQAIYNAFPGQLKNISILGKVPVCRSGINDYAGADGHGNECPYGADAFYAEMTGVVGVDWTDLADNSATSPLGDYNLPGDKQFDQMQISQVGDGVVELGFGRIDLSTGINTEVEADRNYLNKLHRYKIADPSFLPGRKVCDRLTYANEREADLQSMPGVVGMSNINFITGSQLPSVQGGQDADQLYTTQNGPYLFYFKGSGGPGQGINGKAVFWTGMQSHWGYWYQASLVSSGSNLMQLRLAENSFTLDFTWNIWGMRYIYHRLGMGLDAGDMMKQSINNRGWTTGPYTYKFNNTSNGDYSGSLYMNQMGDPALRIFMFAPPTGLSVTKSGSNAQLTWTASTEPTVTGYHVYRAAYANAPYTRLTSTPFATTSYTDTTAGSGSYVYMVRAIRLESTGGGTFYNASLGATQSINLAATPAPLAITPPTLPTVAWNTAANLALTAQGGYPQYTWTLASGALPPGLTLSPLGVISGSTTAVGTFSFSVQAQDQAGATTTQSVSLTVGQNSSNVIYPEATSYTISSSPTSSFGTTETAEVIGPAGAGAETFHRYNLSTLDPANGVAKATVYLYVTANTAATVISQMQANLIADSADGWVANGISKFFTGISSGGAGKTLFNAPAHNFTTGQQVTVAGLTGTGAPVGPYAITVVDADNFSIPVTYNAAWAYDPALSYVTAVSMTYNTRPTTYDTTVPILTASGTNAPGTLLSFDVTSYVKRALAFPSKKMGIRFFTGTSSAIFTGTLNSFGNTVPYLVVQASNAPSIVVNTPTISPAQVNIGSGIFLGATVTAIPAQAATLSVQWSKVSGPGTTTFTSPTSASTGASFSAPGVYTLRITANDGALTSTQDISVAVLSAPIAGPQDSLVARFALDDAAGSTTATNAVSGAPTGTLASTPNTLPLPAYTSAGMINGALSFTGGQRVDVPDSATFQMDGNRQMAISLWFYSNAFQASSSNYNAVICKRTAAFNKESFSMAMRGGNTTSARMYWDMGTGGTSGTVFAVNKWYHVVMMFDGTTTTNNVQLWVNGYPDAFVSTATQTTVTRNATSNVRIGAYDAADTIGWNGMIDEVRIYNRLLTAAEIQDLAGAKPSNLGPVITTSSSLNGAAGQSLGLSATVTDDGNPSPSALTFNWSQLTGPSTLSILSPNSLSTSTTPSAAGNYGLLFTVSDGSITTYATVGAAITGPPAVTYASWASGKGLSGSSALPTTVISADGLNNLYKYALGLDPFTNYNAGDVNLPKVLVQNTAGSNYLALSFNGVATDVTYTVQASGDLVTWTNIQTFASGGTAPGAVTVQDTQAVGASPKRFMRLIMTNP